MNWFALHTKPRSELLAQTSLAREGIETFYPKLKQRKTIRRVRRWVIGPLFPSYIFARFDVAKSGRLVRYANGVATIVSFGGNPALVEDALIDLIRNHCTLQADGKGQEARGKSVGPATSPLPLTSSRAPGATSPLPLTTYPACPDTVLLEPMPFRAGDRVEIQTGPMRGLQGVFERELSDRDRVVILLDALAKGARVQLTRDQLEKVA